MADDPKPPPPPIDPEIEALITKLAAELPSLPDNDEASRRFEWLLDLLILRDQLPASFKRLAAKIQADRGTKIRLSLVTDKYDVESPPIDCASRLHLCGARCCSFEVALSPQDIKEGQIPFEIDRPYLLPRDPETKRCACMDDKGVCTKYERACGSTTRNGFPRRCRPRFAPPVTSIRSTRNATDTGRLPPHLAPVAHSRSIATLG
jgi:hypothetical protein